MKAVELFELTVYSDENGVAIVGDGQERFEVKSEGLSQEIELNAKEDALMKAYDSWCLEWAA